MSTTVRISDETHQRFARLAEQTGRPMSRLLDEAADALERSLFFDQMADRWAALRDDESAWRSISEERATEAGGSADSSR
ncbi:MAG: hypothetical protein Q8K63_07230 [Acidimicrobiales bacterium]|nr:hypothetical protein [Acidimicrobiales bacterium]